MSASGEPPHQPGDDQPPEDPFERLVLDEDFIRSAPISEISARARQKKSRQQRWRRWRARFARIARRDRSGGDGRSRRARRYRASDGPYGAPAAQPWHSQPRGRRRRRLTNPASWRLPDWTVQQWLVTAAFAVAVAAYLYFSLGGPR